MRTNALAALAVACTLPLAACGTSVGGTTGSAPPAAASGSQNRAGTTQSSAQMAKFEACLKNRGVSAQPPGTSSGGPAQMTEEQQAAFKACRKYLPSRPDGSRQGGPGGAPPNGYGPPPNPPQGTVPQQTTPPTGTSTTTTET
ncbi:MAG: hypothetical protein V9E83_11055 [Baekduia sp.]